jgi:hypothetical protein
MKILALERESLDATAEQFERFGKAEARKVWDMHMAGVIRELYFRSDENTAVLILECNSLRAAASFLSNLPYVQEGLVSFDLIPLHAYTGFSRLFSTDELSALSY